MRDKVHRPDISGAMYTTLSEKYAGSTGCRSLDILHVASAIVLGIRDFLTFDARQGDLARKARLRVLPATT